MNGQLAFNFKNEETCFLCNCQSGNQTWSVVKNGKAMMYCSIECLEIEHPRKEVKFSLMDYYKGKK